MGKEELDIKIESIKRIMKTDYFLLISIIVFFPLGLYLLWKNKSYSKRVKIIVSIILPLKFIWVIFLFRNIQINKELSNRVIQVKQVNDDLRDRYEQKNKLYVDQVNQYKQYKDKMEPYEKLSEADLQKKKKNIEEADKVSSQINEIPSVELLTLEHKEKVEKIKKDYDSLNDEQKVYIAASSVNELVDKMKEIVDKSKKEEEEKQKQKEEREKLAKEKAEEEAKGYDTGITYQQLARTPDKFLRKKVKFSGKVLQVMEGDSRTQLRVAVDGNYDTVVYADYDKSIVTSRILEDDYITISGISDGLLSYESTLGGTITIPSIDVKKID